MNSYSCHDINDGTGTNILNPNGEGTSSSSAIAISLQIDNSECAVIEPVEKLGAEAADTITALLVGSEQALLSFFLLGSHQLVEELEETEQGHEERSQNNASDVLLAVSGRGISIGSGPLEIPWCSSTSDNERSSLNEKDQIPKQVENVEDSNCNNPAGHIELLEGVFMLSISGSSKRVISQSFEDPKSDEEDHDDEQKNGKEDDAAVSSDESGRNLDDRWGKGESLPHAAHHNSDQNCKQKHCNSHQNSGSIVVDEGFLSGLGQAGHHEKIDSKQDERDDGGEDEEVDEAGSSESDEEDDDQREKNGNGERQNDENVIFHNRGDHFSRSTQSCSKFSLQHVGSWQADSVCAYIYCKILTEVS